MPESRDPRGSHQSPKITEPRYDWRADVRARAAKLEALRGIARDAVLAVRSLSRSPGVAIPAVVALALGIGITTSMFSVIYGTLFKGLPFHDSNRIAAVAMADQTMPVDQQDAMSLADFDAFRTRQRSFQSFGAYYFRSANVSGGDRPDRISTARVMSEVFDITGVRPLLGRTLVSRDNAVGAPPVAVLGYQMWRDRFASDSAVVGKSLRVNQGTYTIVGVMPDRFTFPGMVQVWLPLQIDRATLRPSGADVLVIGRLRDGISYDMAGAEFSALAKTIGAERGSGATPTKLVAMVHPFIRNVIRPQVYALSYAMLAAVGLVLLVACANVANLLLHRAADRMKEIGIRAALGASRVTIVRRALVESLLLAGVGAVLGAGIAQAFVVWFNHALPVNEAAFWIDIRLHLPVLAFAIAIAIVAGITAGVLPAIQSARIDVGAILKDDVFGVSQLRIGRLSRGVVVVEIAVASAMLVAAGFITKSILRLERIEPGFRTEGVLTATVSLSSPDSVRAMRFFRELEAALGTTAGIDRAYIGNGLPGTGWHGAPISVDGRNDARPHDRPRVGWLAVGPGFFETFGVKVTRGRPILVADRFGTKPVAVVSESFARQIFRGEDPIGRRIRLEDGRPGPWLTIVGVMPTLYSTNPQNPWPKEVLASIGEQGSSATAAIALVGSGDLAASLRRVVASLEADTPLYQVSTMDALLKKNAWPMRVFGGSFAVFGLAALVLAAIGLYAVMSFSVSRRMREMGIRLALGATRLGVVRMIVREASVTIGLGMTIGLLLGAVVAQGLSAVLFGVTPRDASVFATIGGVLVSVALAACLVPAIRATRLDPVTALRSE